MTRDMRKEARSARLYIWAVIVWLAGGIVVTLMIAGAM